MTGVLALEIERQKRWRDLGLPDPLRVLGEERAARLYVRGFRSPKRGVLDAHFETHPHDRPSGW